MAGNNSTVRRSIAYLLWDETKALTKEEILSRLITGGWGLITEPTGNSLGSLLAKNPQVKRGENQRVFCGDGRFRSVPTFLLNRELIQEYEDILLTLPINALRKSERELASICRGCGRTRVKPTGSETCLICLRS
jgi:hypothetical protein